MLNDSRPPETVPPIVIFATMAGIQQMMPRRSPGIFGTIAASGLAAAAVWFGIGSVREFRKYDTTVTPVNVEKASVLVMTGPNAISRNPMYVALLLGLIANTLRRGSVLGLMPAGVFAVAIDRLQIQKEESALQKTFGREFDRYCSRTPRWLML